MSPVESAYARHERWADRAMNICASQLKKHALELHARLVPSTMWYKCTVPGCWESIRLKFTEMLHGVITREAFTEWYSTIDFFNSEPRIFIPKEMPDVRGPYQTRSREEQDVGLRPSGVRRGSRV